MSSETSNSNGKKQWESVHICPACALMINLSEMDFKAVTTGIVECPRCDWVGPIEIQIAQEDGDD